MSTYFQDIEHHLINSLLKSEERILIAVAWFTNQSIADALLSIKSIQIDIVVDDNKINRQSGALKKLSQSGIPITFINNFGNYIMHNKFCVIDNFVVLTGSYNWTYNAKLNDENLTIVADSETANFYNIEFSRIKNKEYKIDTITFLKKKPSNCQNKLRKL